MIVDGGEVLSKEEDGLIEDRDLKRRRDRLLSCSTYASIHTRMYEVSAQVHTHT